MVANPVQAFAPGDEGGAVVVVAAAPVHVGVDGADGAVVRRVIVESAPHGRDQILPDGRRQLKDFCQLKDGIQGADRGELGGPGPVNFRSNKNKCVLQLTHTQDLRQLCLTVSWDLRVLRATPNGLHVFL